MINEFGPSWRLVQQFIAEVPHGFNMANLGKEHPADSSVRRVRDWHALRAVVYYGFPDAGPNNCEYLKFLVTVDKAHGHNQDVAQAHALEQQVRAAVDAATQLFCDQTAPSEDFVKFAYGPEYADPYPFCDYSILDHCIYITTEFAVAHLTSIHLLRDMWFWYRSGHWPCGWEGEWPEGRLIVF